MSKLKPSYDPEDHRRRFGFEFGKYRIDVYDKDLITQPHFHVTDCKTHGKKFHCRILFNKPSYYKGETKKLKRKDIQLMCEIMDRYIPKETGIMVDVTQWRMLTYQWNTKNKQQIKETKARPDYLAKLK